jgi:hypothetical protein
MMMNMSTNTYEHEYLRICHFKFKFVQVEVSICLNVKNKLHLFRILIPSFYRKLIPHQHQHQHEDQHQPEPKPGSITAWQSLLHDNHDCMAMVVSLQCTSVQPKSRMNALPQSYPITSD